MPRVTVVINVYDEPVDFVAEAIASVRAQTMSVDEIILVEDGITEKYHQLSAENPDLLFVQQENTGLAGARNAGLAAASGEFILFLDGDDRLTPQAIAANLGRLNANPHAMFSYGSWRYIQRSGKIAPPVRMPALGEDGYATLLRGNCIGMHGTVLYRVTALREAGGYDSTYRACEDYELYLRLASRGEIVHGPEILAEYRRHEHNMSNNHVMMLKTINRVLDAQTETVGASRTLQEHRASGRRHWRAHYARQQYLDLLLMMAARTNARRALVGFCQMFREMPKTMIEVLAVEFFSRLKQQARSAFRARRHDAYLLPRKLRQCFPGRGKIDFGHLRRTTPISRWFGFDRGRPIDRKYIEDFLAQHSQDVRGRVLEVGDAEYTNRFGGAQVTQSDILHVDAQAPGVTIVADLADGAGIPDAAFDCVILTQTLHLIYDFHAAVRTLYRILKPGGVLLLTVPGVSSVDKGEWGSTWYWSFTPAAVKRMLESVFQPGQTDIGCHGNVLVATAFLYGLAQHEIDEGELAAADPQYPVIVTARVRKV